MSKKSQEPPFSFFSSTRTCSSYPTSPHVRLLCCLSWITPQLTIHSPLFHFEHLNPHPPSAHPSKSSSPHHRQLNCSPRVCVIDSGHVFQIPTIIFCIWQQPLLGTDEVPLSGFGILRVGPAEGIQMDNWRTGVCECHQNV